MSDVGSQVPETLDTPSIDLWKFFEERGAEQKESLFKLITWIIGFAAVVLGFAIKEGFDRNLKADHPRLVFLLGVVGFVVVFHAILIVLDHGWHINRTLARANKARDGESAPRKIWDAGDIAGRKWSLPPICTQLLFVVGLFAAGFAALILVAWMEVR
jgi:vacuolar-type H+-ATPase subunit I/STV1